MIPTLEEWLENREFEGYNFAPPVVVNWGRDLAVHMHLTGRAGQAMRAPLGHCGLTRSELVRFLKRNLVAWAKSRGFNP